MVWREREPVTAAPIHLLLLLLLRSDCPSSLSLSLSIQCLSLCDQLSEVIKPLFSHSTDDDDDAPRVARDQVPGAQNVKTVPALSQVF